MAAWHENERHAGSGGQLSTVLGGNHLIPVAMQDQLRAVKSLNRCQVVEAISDEEWWCQKAPRKVGGPGEPRLENQCRGRMLRAKVADSTRTEGPSIEDDSLRVDSGLTRGPSVSGFECLTDALAAGGSARAPVTGVFHEEKGESPTPWLCKVGRPQVDDLSVAMGEQDQWNRAGRGFHWR